VRPAVSSEETTPSASAAGGGSARYPSMRRIGLKDLNLFASTQENTRFPNCNGRVPDWEPGMGLEDKTFASLVRRWGRRMAWGAARQ
jgi:hypothetical protein